jgi:hypothetical protein
VWVWMGVLCWQVQPDGNNLRGRICEEKPRRSYSAAISHKLNKMLRSHCRLLTQTAQLAGRRRSWGLPRSKLAPVRDNFGASGPRAGNNASNSVSFRNPCCTSTCCYLPILSVGVRILSYCIERTIARAFLHLHLNLDTEVHTYGTAILCATPLDCVAYMPLAPRHTISRNHAQKKHRGTSNTHTHKQL